MTEYFISVDVGSFSVRSGLFLWDKTLTLIERAEIKIEVFNDEEDIYEQSSENIWKTVCLVTKMVLFRSKININLVKGISFDGTCSLVALDKNNLPLTVSRSGNNNRNIIMWMDHRANEEAAFINKSNHRALRSVGGKISIEMQPPKILWLKKNMSEFMSHVSSLYDLPDYLTYRATGSRTRSLCSVTCKWAFDAENKCWDKSFWECCLLSELCDDNCAKIGNEFCYPGSPIGGGLSDNAATELGLLPGITVPASLIDAYAGMLGAISAHDQLITIAGTSACHMTLCSSPIYIDGIWGPYKNVLMKNHYVLEAGQSAVGILLDRVLQLSTVKLKHEDVVKHLLEAVAIKEDDHLTLMNLPPDKWLLLNSLANDIHVNPDFLGNRSPRSNPNVLGSMIGISLDNSASYISKIYLAAIHGLAYGFKEIITALMKKSVPIESIKVCGGLSINGLYLKVLSDVSGFPVAVSPNEDLVLTGTAMLNVIDHISVFDHNKDDLSTLVRPDVSLAEFHKRKFAIFEKIVDFQLTLNMRG